jgi:hypothetical protein
VNYAGFTSAGTFSTRVVTTTPTPLRRRRDSFYEAMLGYINPLRLLLLDLARFLFPMHSSRDGFHHPHHTRADRPSVTLGPDHDVDVHFKGVEQSHQLIN